PYTTLFRSQREQQLILTVPQSVSPVREWIRRATLVLLQLTVERRRQPPTRPPNLLIPDALVDRHSYLARSQRSNLGSICKGALHYRARAGLSKTTPPIRFPRPHPVDPRNSSSQYAHRGRYSHP